MPTRHPAERAQVVEKEDTVPTGVHIRDVREQLFEAAERVLLRDGPDGLTSRAVTTEAGVAKGVLHRHFADVDALAPTLIGAGHLLFADRTATPLDAAAVRKIVTSVVAGVVQEPQP
jgi:AcrR family transcriptional regulator